MLYWLLAKEHFWNMLNFTMCKAGNIYLTSPLTFIFLLWTINEKKREKNKTKLYHSKPSKAGYNFGSKVTEHTTIMNHSVSTSNRMGSQQGLVLIRQTWLHSMDESCRFVRNHSHSPWMKGSKKEVLVCSHTGNNYANSSDGGEFSLKAQEKSWEWENWNYMI